MKKIFIILTHTGTVLSRIITGYTGSEFSHISIALDQELNQMYSFGRLNAYNPFVGGFVHEYIDKGTFKRFKNTKCKIYAFQIEDNQYETIKQEIGKVEINKEQYKFNYVGLFAAGFNLRITPKQSFYCAEFVKYVIESAGINTGLPQVIKPEDFKNMQELKEIYSGKLKNYNMSKTKVAEALKNLLIYTKKEGVI